MKHVDDGYVLLSLLVFLVSLGAGWISVASGVSLIRKVPNAIAEHDRHALVDARQSLLSYAALYPYLYGATGAGPAHLPCPDTDGMHTAGTRQPSGAQQRRDGPNPPCASLRGSQGMLARHTLLPGYRYLFHSQSRQRLGYSVAGGFVNNPINRVINLQQLLTHAHQSVATIRLPSLVDSTTMAQVSITGSSLAPGVVSSVASWVVDRSHQHHKSACMSPVQGHDSLIQPSDMPPCFPALPLMSTCADDAALMLVLDVPLVQHETCLSDTLALNTIEGVPALRHWFVRNQWYRFLKLTDHDECNTGGTAPISTCVLSFRPEALKAAIEHSNVVELHWVRAS